MWVVRGSSVSAGCVLSVVSSASPNHQPGNPPFPITVPCLPARLLATHSGDGPQLIRVEMEFTGRPASSCGFSREGRMMGSQDDQASKKHSSMVSASVPASKFLPCWSPCLGFSSQNDGLWLGHVSHTNNFLSSLFWSVLHHYFITATEKYLVYMAKQEARN